MINYDESDEFKKDLKKLVKRFSSLPDDLMTVKKAVIELWHIKGINNLSTVEISGFSSEDFCFYKIRKFACKSLKGKGVHSGMRVVYKWYKKTNKVLFIEIYFKGDKENENRNRIKEYI